MFYVLASNCIKTHVRALDVLLRMTTEPRGKFSNTGYPYIWSDGTKTYGDLWCWRDSCESSFPETQICHPRVDCIYLQL